MSFRITNEAKQALENRKHCEIIPRKIWVFVFKDGLEQAIMPYSTVERVDCMATEQYNISSLRGESSFQGTTILVGNWSVIKA